MLEAWVGLRPGRPTVRLEKEVMKFKDKLGKEKSLKVGNQLSYKSKILITGKKIDFILLCSSLHLFGSPYKGVLFARLYIYLLGLPMEYNDTAERHSRDDTF